MFGRKKDTRIKIHKNWRQPQLQGWDFCMKLLENPHVLIGGATGSGKSVLLNDILWTITASDPREAKLILIDLKRVELTQWHDFPHVWDVVTEPEQVNQCLDSVIDLMERRYKEMQETRQTTTNRCNVYVVIDEAREVFNIKGALHRIDKLMRLARAARIHLIMATQNVSRSTGVPAYIFQNVSATVGLRCNSATESRQIIGRPGAEELPKFGRCIIKDSDGFTCQEIPYMPQSTIDTRLQAYRTA